jgi:hypothetical protein
MKTNIFCPISTCTNKASPTGGPCTQCRSALYYATKKGERWRVGRIQRLRKYLERTESVTKTHVLIRRRA